MWQRCRQRTRSLCDALVKRKRKRKREMEKKKRGGFQPPVFVLISELSSKWRRRLCGFNELTHQLRYEFFLFLSLSLSVFLL